MVKIYNVIIKASLVRVFHINILANIKLMGKYQKIYNKSQKQTKFTLN